MKTNFLSDLWFAKLFLQSLACLFIFLTVSFEGEALINFSELQINDFFFLVYVHAFCVLVKQSLCIPKS